LASYPKKNYRLRRPEKKNVQKDYTWTKEETNNRGLEKTHNEKLSNI
jgi:hypothetical protein